MNPRVNYEMTESDLEEILEACKPVPCIMIPGCTPASAQENANRAWEKLGKKMGFDSTTVRPLDKGQRFFSAVPSETEAQRDARVQREQEQRVQVRITQLQEEITARQGELDALTKGGM